MKIEYIITIVLVVLRMNNVIDWSWYLVLSPLLILIGLWLITFTLLVVVKTKEKIKEKSKWQRNNFKKL